MSLNPMQLSGVFSGSAVHVDVYGLGVTQSPSRAGVKVNTIVKRWWLPQLVASVLMMGACSGGDDGGPDEPAPVAQVQVTSSATTIEVGETAQLTVTLRDAQNNVLTGRAVTFQTSSQTVATVTPAGVVLGVSAGPVTITATSEGESGTVTLNVTGGNTGGAPAISGITPATLIPGETATIAGTGFNASALSNTVTIGGEQVIVTNASETSLQITVPANLCIPSGAAGVVVRVGSQQSATFSHQVQNDAPPLQVAVGELTLVESTDGLCVRFGSAAANESYVFGVQNGSESAANVEAIQVAAATPGAVAAPALSPDLRPPLMGGTIGGQEPSSPRVQRWLRHRAAELRLRASERAMLPGLFRAAAARRRDPRLAEAAQAAAIPSNVQVGDMVTIRVPDLGSASTCFNYNEIQTVVRVIGERGVWLDDVANPANGLQLSDFQSLSDRFDDQIWATNVAWFGEPTDHDGNSRAVIVVTKEVNREDGVLGFVAAADLAPRTTCTSSDFGEIYYGRSADPAGQFGEEYSVEEAQLDAVQLISHEFTHIIQFSRRLDNPSALDFQSAWELEGQAVLGEEVNGHAATGRTGGQDYGFEVAFTGSAPNAIPSDIAWYVGGFIDLAIFYGLNIDNNDNLFKTANAPEQCSWLGRQTDGNNGPCLSGREVYGTSWMFLRWLTDHFAASTAGGGQGVNRALIDGTVGGFANITDFTAEPINELLAQWAAALWLDGRETAVNGRLTMPSWDLFDVFAGLVDEAHLQPRNRSFGAFTDNVSVRGGSSAYFTISGSSRPNTYIRVRRQNGSQVPAAMQVWVVRTR